MTSMRRASGRNALLSAHYLALLTLATFLVTEAAAQQRVIVNPNFVQRFQRVEIGGGGALPDYSAAVTPSLCSAPGSCLRYLGDARCLTPTGWPVDTGGCMVGWMTTDPYDGNSRAGGDLHSSAHDGHIKAPTQVGIGPDLEGLSVPNGAAELTAENPGRLFQRVCLAANEVIPFSYSLGDPDSTPSSPSQARFGIFLDDFIYPGIPAGPSAMAVSSIVSTQTMVPQSGTVTGPPVAGVYQIGFEAIQPASGIAGNYIADVSITLKPFIDFVSTNVGIVSEGESGSFLVRVNGTVPAGGIYVSLSRAPGTAAESDLTLGTPTAFGTSVVGSPSVTSNGAGGYLLFIPQGSYDGNALSDAQLTTNETPSGSISVPIITTADTVIENQETFGFTIEPPGSNGSSPATQWDRTPDSCSSPGTTFTASIADNDIDLVTTKSVSSPTPAAGSDVTYTVTFTNNTARPTFGRVVAHDTLAAVTDEPPAGITFTSWTCTASGGARCPGGTVNGTTSGSAAISGNANLPAGNGAAGGSITYSIIAAVDAAQCSSVTNTSTITKTSPRPEEGTSAQEGFITPVPGGTANNSSSTVITPVCAAALVVTKSDGSPTYTPGSTASYTVTVTNSGPVAANGVSVTDTLPSAVTLTATPNCVAAGTATCGTITGSAGASTFSATGASLAAGAGNSLTYTLPVAFGPSMTADPLVNTATATADNAPLVTGSDSDARAPMRVDISKTTASSIAEPGGTVTYTVIATNSGSVAAPNSRVSDTIPTGLSSFAWTCTPAGGAVCPAETGTGVIDALIATFPAGSSVTYQITAAVSAAPPATITNTASITPPDGGLCSNNSAPPCSNSASLGGGAIVSLQKSSTTTSFTPNGIVDFVVTATNSGSVAADGTVISDPIPTGIASQSWTCSATGGATCPSAAGNGAVDATIATFPAGSSITWSIAATATSNPPANITNNATATPPAGGVCNGSCSASVTVAAAPVVAVSATASRISVAPGQPATFTVVVSNGGSGPADGTNIDAAVPPELTSYSWTCTASGGAVCPRDGADGAIEDLVTVFPSGGSLSFTITATPAPSLTGTITHSLVVTPPDGGLCAGLCVAETHIGGLHAVPSLGTLAQCILLLSLGFAAVMILKR